MTVLDAFAAISILKREPAALAVRELVEKGDGRMTALGELEVIDHLIRLVGATEEDAVLDLRQLRLREPIVVDRTLALSAARLRARRYHRKASALSLADCVAAEAARAAQAPLATADPALLRVCHQEGIDYVALAASDGSTWTP